MATGRRPCSSRRTPDLSARGNCANCTAALRNFTFRMRALSAKMIDYYAECSEAQSKSSRHLSPARFRGSGLSYAGWNAAICTRSRGAEDAFLRIMLAEGIPVLANDFSQSCVEGPRMFPSM